MESRVGWLLDVVIEQQYAILWIKTTEGSVLRQIAGLTAHDKPLGWTSDNRSIYISTHTDTNKTIRVSIFDLDSASRKPWKEINPTRPVDELSTFVITPDGTAYAYNFLQTTSDLYLIQGFN